MKTKAKKKPVSLSVPSSPTAVQKPSDIFKSDEDDTKSESEVIDLKEELKKKEAENEDLRKKTEILIKILQKKN